MNTRRVVLLLFIFMFVTIVCSCVAEKDSDETNNESIVKVTETTQVAETTTEIYIEKATTEFVTETTEPVAIKITENNDENNKEQPEFDIKDVDSEYREVFSIAQEEGKHIGEIMLQQEIEDGKYDLENID